MSRIYQHLYQSSMVLLYLVWVLEVAAKTKTIQEEEDQDGLYQLVNHFFLYLYYIWHTRWHCVISRIILYVSYHIWEFTYIAGICGPNP